MKTEEYIIILVGVTADEQEIQLRYNAKAPVIARISGPGGEMTAETGMLPAGSGLEHRIPNKGMTAGSYTCRLYLGEQQKDSRTFEIK